MMYAVVAIFAKLSRWDLWLESRNMIVSQGKTFECNGSGNLGGGMVLMAVVMVVAAALVNLFTGLGKL